MKRAFTVLFGSVLLIGGIRRRSRFGMVAALLGGWLVWRAFGGSDRIGQTLESQPRLSEESPEQTLAPAEIEVSRSITIGKPADELYDAWRDPDQLSKVMGHVAEVTSTEQDQLQWTLHGPLGQDISWETKAIPDESGESLSWEPASDIWSLSDASVHFRTAPGDRGTVVTLSVRFDPPGGPLGQAMFERLDIVPEAVIGSVLSRFKSLIETGEIPTLEANPSARGVGDQI